MSSDRINYLVRRYATNRATSEEVEELFAWLRLRADDKDLHDELEKMAAATIPDNNYDPAYWEPFIDKALKGKREVKRRDVRNIYTLNRGWRRYAAAAAILLLISTAIIWVLSNNKRSEETLVREHRQSTNDVLPGRERAILTLANGEAIKLDTALGAIVKQDNLSIVNRNGMLDYEGKANTEQYHTLSTPNGGQYRLRLPDGTDVWLNAASSITYPVGFVGAERRVTVKGEAYFEVAKDTRKPFRVDIDKQSTVEVLGTHFNINSYADDGNIKTTLLEGSIKVTSRDKQVVIKPGQQAVSAAVSGPEGPGLTVIDSGIDLVQVMAWKNGLFNFEQANLKTVMAQLGRWYDIEIKYEGNIPDRTFRGKITRDLNLSQVISILEDVEVKFRIEGRTLVVMP
ncbi:MAG: FecR domain-containing protein [Chitinophagaceae bacterium]|nr:FecR domain-containing protein [Chitinophagaceae bacterium]